MGAELGRRLRLLLWAGASTGLAIACLALFIVSVVSLPLIAVWVGIPMLFASIVATRFIAKGQRIISGHVLNLQIGSPYVASTGGNLLVRLRTMVTEPATWRDAGYLAFNATAGLTLCIVAIIESFFKLIFWWLPKTGLVHAQARICVAFLAPNERTALAQEVQRLAQSRAETVDTSAAELRRIERDLHDGAQARLVALGMTLGLAEEEISRNPDYARELVAEARQASSVALADLRDLVRGIHPPVLADRGLVGAVEALALATPIPVHVQATIPGRLAAPVESAAYFAIAEALANAAKHSEATLVEIGLVHAEHPNTLHIVLQDNGIGGADPSAGTGLRGIERRLSAFDGTLEVISPTGGPTRLAIVLPCGSSSPKTLPSSGTA